MRPWHAALAAAMLAAAVNAPAVPNTFAGDDRWVVIERPDLRDPPSVAAVLRAPFWPASFGGVMWRPAVIASFALDYQISTRPQWFHVTNVVWAAIAAGLLAAVAALVAGPAAGFGTGLLFAVHPVHVEATAGIVGRAELMAAAGYAAALLCAIRAERVPRYLWGVAAGAALAIASKEHAATLPAAVLLLAAGRARDDGAPPNGAKRWTGVWWRGVRGALPAAGASALPILTYAVVRPLVLHDTIAAGGLAPGLGGLGLVARAWAMLPITLEWWRLLLFPVHLSADYSPADVVVTTALTPRHLVGALVWAAAVWVAWRLRGRVPAVALGLAWFVVTVAPVSNLAIPTELLVAERTLFLPSWGVMLAIGALWAAWPAGVRVRAVALAAVVLAGAVRSVARVPVWHDEERYFQALVRDAPRSYRTLWIRGRNEFGAGRWGSGEQLLRSAIAAAPAVPGPRDDLARAYGAARLWGPAVGLVRESIARDSSRAPPWAMLPGFLLAGGDTAGAMTAARDAAGRFPGDSAVQAAARTVLAR